MELAADKRPRRGPRGPGGAPFGGIPGQSRQTDFPLRILVQSDMVSVVLLFIVATTPLPRVMYKLALFL